MKFNIFSVLFQAGKEDSMINSSVLLKEYDLKVTPQRVAIVFLAEHTRKNYAVWLIISLIFLPDLTVHTVEQPERKET